MRYNINVSTPQHHNTTHNLLYLLLVLAGSCLCFGLAENFRISALVHYIQDFPFPLPFRLRLVKTIYYYVDNKYKILD